jgi:hypothetical protein
VLVPEIRPFPGVFYRVPETDLSKVLAPPYDVIPPAYQSQLYDRDPRNIVRVILTGIRAMRLSDAGSTFRRGSRVCWPRPATCLYLLKTSRPRTRP